MKNSKAKTCSKCQEDKPLEAFYRHKGGKYGVRAQCIPCRNVKASEWVSNNPDKVAVVRAKANKTQATQKYRKDYRNLNKTYFLAKNSEYRSRKLNATPTWLTEEHKAEMQAFYEHAKDCKAVSGQDYEVDHIIPLRGENISGLHVPWNLQVLPAALNREKSNKHETDDYGTDITRSTSSQS